MAVANTIALIFDFDDTLVPDSTTLLLRNCGIDPQRFWNKDLKELIGRGYDPTLGFLRLLLDNVGPGKPLGVLSNAKLREFGASLDQRFHEGLPQLFVELRALAKEMANVNVEYYVISGGLQAVIEGSSIIRDHFAGVYGCQLEEVGDPPALANIKRAINFTEKTRYLFEINKGITAAQSSKNPYLVNKDIRKSRRRIPFTNMVYVGDGLTDIPCFSLLKAHHSICFGVFDPTDETKAKRALLEFLGPGRVVSMHAPRYRPKDELGALLRAHVANLCQRLNLEGQTAEYSEEDDD